MKKSLITRMEHQMCSPMHYIGFDLNLSQGICLSHARYASIVNFLTCVCRASHVRGYTWSKQSRARGMPAVPLADGREEASGTVWVSPGAMVGSSDVPTFDGNNTLHPKPYTLNPKP